MRHFVGAAVLLVAACVPGVAQKERVEMGWTGERGYFERRIPSNDHPLQYYLSAKRQQEFLRAETDNCAFKASCEEAKVEVSKQRVRAPFGKRIIQILYAMKAMPQNAGDGPATRSYWKSIVAETRPGMYREIFLLKNEGGFWLGPPATAAVIAAGDTKVLFTNDLADSRDMWCTGEFWVLEKSGPKLADFSAVTAAIHKKVPADSQAATPMCAAVRLADLEVRMSVQKNDAECRACGSVGQVIVKFNFNGRRAVPVSSELLREEQSPGDERIQ